MYIYICVCVYMEPFKSKSKILKDSRPFPAAPEPLRCDWSDWSLALSRYAAG